MSGEARTVQTKSGPKTLVGRAVKEGDKAPMNVPMVTGDMQAVNLSDYRGKVRLFSVTPSLDTSLCNTQTRTFNERLREVAGDYEAFAISADLPHAQRRFVEEHKIDHLKVLSDYRDVAFGENFGVLMKENRLLARSVVVVDENDTIRYMEIMENQGSEPDYERALAALKEAMGR